MLSYFDNVLQTTNLTEMKYMQKKNKKKINKKDETSRNTVKK